LQVANLKPVDQFILIMKLKAEDGTSLEEEIYWTIHQKLK